MPDRQDGFSPQAAEGDRLDQQRDAWEEPHDPERATGVSVPDGVEADPADVAEQAIEVPDEEDEEREGA